MILMGLDRGATFMAVIHKSLTCVNGLTAYLILQLATING